MIPSVYLILLASPIAGDYVVVFEQNGRLVCRTPRGGTVRPTTRQQRNYYQALKEIAQREPSPGAPGGEYRLQQRPPTSDFEVVQARDLSRLFSRSDIAGLDDGSPQRNSARFLGWLGTHQFAVGAYDGNSTSTWRVYGIIDARKRAVIPFCGWPAPGGRRALVTLRPGFYWQQEVNNAVQLAVAAVPEDLLQFRLEKASPRRLTQGRRPFLTHLPTGLDDVRFSTDARWAILHGRYLVSLDQATVSLLPGENARFVPAH